jgi:hypothetical protein
LWQEEKFLFVVLLEKILNLHHIIVPYITNASCDIWDSCADEYSRGKVFVVLLEKILNLHHGSDNPNVLDNLESKEWHDLQTDWSQFECIEGLFQGRVAMSVIAAKNNISG